MLHKFLTILVTMKAVQSDIIDYKCTHSDEFFYTTPLTQCSSYYRCYQNQKLKYDCAHGTVYDFYKQKCTTSGVCYEPVCQGKTDGVYADTTQACRRYFRCSGGKITSVENCRHGYLHNGKICQQQQLVTCELPKSTAVAYPYSAADNKNSNSQDDCRYLSDGLHSSSSSSDCKDYIKCNNKKLVSKHRCSSSLVFDTSSCVPDTLYECPKSSKFDKLCSGKYDGLYADPRFGCTSYVKCAQSVPIEFLKCGKGQIFDPEKRACIFSSTNTRCRFEKISSECSTMDMGFYQDRSFESSCHDYFFCYNGAKTKFNCELGKVFNGENCVEERLYHCPNQDEGSCDTKEDGYYKNKNLDCRAYFFCSSNRKYSFICNDGQAFDGSKCVVKRHAQQCVASVDCDGKLDGYYQDVPSSCSKYYFCKQGDKVQVLTCRNGRVFNGNSCVAKSSYACPIVGSSLAAQLNCVPRKCKTCEKNGFFAEINSRCKSYMFCIDGKATNLSCSGNFVFSEETETCVPSDSYQCPNYCSNECSD